MMDKTIKINLAGILFQIDEEAYQLLRDYLQAIHVRFKNIQGGNETVDDIEARIAEIFQSQKGLSGIISKENVEAMIGLIGKPEDFEHVESTPETQTFGAYRRRLYRNRDDSIISGVCGGIGAYLNIDPVWIRISFILFAVFFGIGFFVYVALWIALPEAKSDGQKRELYGENYNTRTFHKTREQTSNSDPTAPYQQVNNKVTTVGHAFNEIFRAIGKFCFIFCRIILIILGVCLVLTGFLVLFTFVVVFIFKYPGAFSTDAFGMNLSYLPDFLKYIVTPSLVPWITVLLSIVVALPLLALIYGGVKMIFWFRAKDGVLSLILFVIWVLSLASLSIILFNEGISFAENGRTSSQVIFKNKPDTLYIITDRKVKDLPFSNEISIPDENYTVFLVDSTYQLFIRSKLHLFVSEGNNSKVEIRKRSFGRNRPDAIRKAESLIYNYRISNDTLYLDEYFTIPPGRKWSGDNLSVNLYLPENTILYFDGYSHNMFYDKISTGTVENSMVSNSRVDHDTDPGELGYKYWVFSEKGLKETEKEPLKQK
jgi:phage shock protein PspC (stress-responsive transcriptional regulator)